MYRKVSKKYKIIGAVIFTVSVVGVLLILKYGLFDDAKYSEKEQQIVNEDNSVHSTEQFFDEYFFERGVSAERSQEKSDKHISGAIVPHHLLASFIIADIFAKIAQQGTQTIILLAPNHQNIGNAPVLTSGLAWETPYGKIMPHDEIISSLIQKDYVVADEDILDKEHAIGGLLPFISYYDNTVRIVPLILRQNMTREQLQGLSQSIADSVDDKTVVVASVDFSHYLNSDEAEKNDEKTLKAMEGHDYGALLQMNSDYLDSPEAIVTLLQVMEQLDIKKSEILHHANSGRLMDESFAQTTSYFGTIFVE